MRYIFTLIIMLILLVSCGDLGSGGSSSADSSSDGVQTGVAGSLAQFIIVGDYLYTIDRREMKIFDISTPSQPTRSSKIRLPWDVETIFAYEDKLFIGGNAGMYIYDNSIPTQPTKISSFTHARSCDPVVVSNDVAYVTLNTSNNCGQTTNINRLEMVDISDAANPKLIRTLDMWAPSGLAVDNDTLFICDGDAGLKAFDINLTEDNGTKSVGLRSIYANEEIDCYDLIAKDYNLIVSNHTQIHQIDYSSTPFVESSMLE